MLLFSRETLQANNLSELVDMLQSDSGVNVFEEMKVYARDFCSKSIS